MKKIDFNKQVVDAEDGFKAEFVKKFNMKGAHNFLCVILNPDGSELPVWVDEFGQNSGMPVIKNVPETITFWVPVWRSKEENVYIGGPVEMQDKPTRFCEHADLIKWEGPFTITIDD